ncbi:MAG: hypothetical protein AAF789_03890 [Bacteroidota bacterium]
MKKVIHFLAVLFSSFHFLGREEEQDSTCQIFDEDIAAIFQMDGERFCMENGSIGYDTRNGVPPILVISSSENPDAPTIYISWMLEGTTIEFGVEYNMFIDQYSSLRLADETELTIKSGSLVVEGSNYPNQSILKFYGSFDLIYESDDGGEKQVVGQFSLKL